MTCKDCMYRAMCYKHEHYGYGYEYNEMPCEMFKNKADFVKVVRCKDCKHFAYGVCTNDFALNLSRADDFCSYGERK